MGYCTRQHIRPQPRAERTELIAPPIAFLDLEASGLGPASWPVEVGWCFLSGRPQTMLIKTADGWPDTAWDPAAEKLHGLSRAKLARAGRPPRIICETMNDALADAVVYSDAPDWDGFWLYRLFEAAKIRRRFDLLNFAELFERVSPARFNEAKAVAQAKTPHRHRARPDVLHMRALFRLVGNDDGDGNGG